MILLLCLNEKEREFPFHTCNSLTTGLLILAWCYLVLLLFFSDVTRIMKGGTGSGLTSIMQSLSHHVTCYELEMYVRCVYLAEGGVLEVENCTIYSIWSVGTLSLTPPINLLLCILRK